MQAKAFLSTFVGEHLPAVVLELSRPRFPAAQLLKVLTPIDSIALIGDGQRQRGGFFRELLLSLFEAFGLSKEHDLGTVHLIDESGNRLVMDEMISEKHTPLREQRLSPGLLGWVAMTRLGLLIDDLAKSRFAPIYLSTQMTTRSVVAVPMLVGTRVVGVVNLECHQPDKFKPDDVRMMWYAASQAALAYQIGSESTLRTVFAAYYSDMTRMASVVQSRGPREDTAPRPSSHADIFENLRTLAREGQTHFGATRCDIWLAPEKNKEWLIGTSHPEMPPALAKPRELGWSAYVQRHGRIVLVHRISSATDFQQIVRRKEGDTWKIDDSPPEGPREVNVGGLGNATCQLVAPCLLWGTVVAICWFSFDGDRAGVHNDECKWLDLFTTFVGIEASHILERVKDQESRVVTQVAGLIGSQLKGDLKGNRALFFEAGRRDSHYGSSIGGDCIVFEINKAEDRAMVLVGDAESHGLVGALRMLPLVSAFKLLAGQSGSAKHVMQQLSRVAQFIPECRGTAICFSLESDVGDRVRLSLSSAGHHPLLLIRGGANLSWVPSDEHKEDAAADGPMFGLPPPLRFGEVSRWLEVGDMVVAYTDGITESRDVQEHEFGRAGVMKAAISARREPQSVADAIFEAALKHSGDQMTDDASVLAIRICDRLTS